MPQQAARSLKLETATAFRREHHGTWRHPDYTAGSMRRSPPLVGSQVAPCVPAGRHFRRIGAAAGGRGKSPQGQLLADSQVQRRAMSLASQVQQRDGPFHCVKNCWLPTLGQEDRLLQKKACGPRATQCPSPPTFIQTPQ